jgi:ferredoxin
MESTIVLPVIDLSRCDGCGICVASCPTQAVNLVDGRAKITVPDRCTFCEICESYCPCEAIGRPFRVELA